MSTKTDLKNLGIVLKEYVDIKGHRYIVDGKKVVLDPTKKEIRTAIWLATNLNQKIEILPKIKIPEKIQTADYLISDEYWDLKDIVSNRKDAIRNRIKNQEKQAVNFIIDISKSKMTTQAAEKQIEEIYSLKGYKWVRKIIIKNKNKVIIIIKKS